MSFNKTPTPMRRSSSCSRMGKWKGEEGEEEGEEGKERRQDQG
jgi:hypothetical protein